MTQKCLLDIDFTVKNGFLDCRNQDLTSLKGCPDDVTELNCSWNKLTSLETCPTLKSVITLNVQCNNLTSLEGCNTLKSLTTLYCCGNKLTSLKGCPKSLTTLQCIDNNITSLEGCPNSVITLICSYNQITSLEGCPTGVTKLDCWNPLSKEYIDKTIEQVHQINYIKKFKRGVDIVNNIIREKSALNIQKTWDDYWYKPNEEGESRAAKKGYEAFNNLLLQIES